MARVLLVNMPFSSLRWPALGLSLLKAGLAREGIACEIAYLNFDLAERIGLEAYSWIDDGFGFVLGGERLFAKGHFPSGLLDDDAYASEVLQAADPGFDAADRRAYESLQASIDPFLEGAATSIDVSRYDVVGFTCTFQQTLASLALARRLKAARSDLLVAFGGPACEATMGAELLRHFSEIDLVFSGEADLTFPQVVRAIRDGGPLVEPPGVLTRNPGAGAARSCPERVDLDSLPYPDYDDYFARLERSPLRDEIEPVLVFETARGCWWGAKSQCGFCGLNGGTNNFRSKAPERAIAELRHLRARHGVRRACATDNILDHRYHRTFVPRLAECPLDIELEYELKTNLTRAQTDGLVSAGLRAAQLGIESFSTPVLQRMRKGVTSVQNLQTLKWFTGAGIEVKWNFLYDVPGEDPADYADLPDLISRIAHLVPPQACGPVRIDRFSPYFENPQAFDLGPLRPARAYAGVFPFDEDARARLAYYFESPHRSSVPPEYVRPTLAAIDAWQAAFPTSTLRACEQADTLLILDTRPCARRFEHRLRGLDRMLFAFCDTAHAFAAIAQRARELDRSVTEPSLRTRLDVWNELGLMIHRDGMYLSLAIQDAPRPQIRTESTRT